LRDSWDATSETKYPVLSTLYLVPKFDERVRENKGQGLGSEGRIVRG
jgi:hypothetical protein